MNHEQSYNQGERKFLDGGVPHNSVCPLTDDTHGSIVGRNTKFTALDRETRVCVEISDRVPVDRNPFGFDRRRIANFLHDVDRRRRGFLRAGR